MAIVKTHVVTDGYDKILKSEFPEAVVMEHVKIWLRGVYCDIVLSDVSSSSKIVHSGTHGTTGSGVLRLTDNERNKSSDGGNPQILLAIMENSIDKVMSYSQIVWRNATVEGNSFKQLKLEKCKVSI
jgi:hypothetical protein